MMCRSQWSALPGNTYDWDAPSGRGTDQSLWGENSVSRARWSKRVPTASVAEIINRDYLVV